MPDMVKQALTKIKISLEYPFRHRSSKAQGDKIVLFIEKNYKILKKFGHTPH